MNGNELIYVYWLRSSRNSCINVCQLWNFWKRFIQSSNYLHSVVFHVCLGGVTWYWHLGLEGLSLVFNWKVRVIWVSASHNCFSVKHSFLHPFHELQHRSMIIINIITIFPNDLATSERSVFIINLLLLALIFLFFLFFPRTFEEMRLHTLH